MFFPASPHPPCAPKPPASALAPLCHPWGRGGRVRGPRGSGCWHAGGLGRLPALPLPRRLPLVMSPRLSPPACVACIDSKLFGARPTSSPRCWRGTASSAGAPIQITRRPQIIKARYNCGGVGALGPTLREEGEEAHPVPAACGSQPSLLAQRSPELLSKEEQGFFFFFWGVVAMAERGMNPACLCQP